MGAKAAGLDDPADGAGLNQLPGFDGGFLGEMFAETDGIDAPGLRLDAPRLFQLRQIREGGFIGHVIFAMPHDAYAQARSFTGQRRAEDQLDAFVFQDLGDGLRLPRLWVGSLDAQDAPLIHIVKGGQLRACRQHKIDPGHRYAGAQSR